jgi:hypothetical protein
LKSVQLTVVRLAPGSAAIAAPASLSCGDGAPSERPYVTWMTSLEVGRNCSVARGSNVVCCETDECFNHALRKNDTCLEIVYVSRAK